MTKCPSRNKFTTRLTTRDRQLLKTLYFHQALSRDQLIDLGFFGSVPHCNARMSTLCKYNYARQLRPPVGAAGSQRIFSCGPASFDLLCEAGCFNPAEVQRKLRSDVAPLFLGHTLSVGDLHVAFRRSCQPGNLELVRFLPELACCHRFSTRQHQAATWETHVHRPDAYVELADDSSRYALTLESDLGTVSRAQFAVKVSNEQLYLNSGAFASAFGLDCFTVLVVTVSEQRLRSLECLTVGIEAPTFAFTVRTQVEEHGVFGPIWRTCRGRDRRSLMDVVAEQ